MVITIKKELKQMNDEWNKLSDNEDKLRDEINNLEGTLLCKKSDLREIHNNTVNSHQIYGLKKKNFIINMENMLNKIVL